jgi:hypothetical protein
MNAWRQRYHHYGTRLYGPSPRTAWLSWIAEERIAIGNLPTGKTLPKLPDEGVTHIVNCRSTAQTLLSQDLAVERALLGPSRVVHAPLWDSGRPSLRTCGRPPRTSPPKSWLTSPTPAYRTSVEQWLAAGAMPVGPLRIR